MADNEKVKQTVKDSVFTNLFGNPKYLLQLYQALHPEDFAKGDIINQYVSFTKVLNEQVKKHGKTKEAVREAIRICKDGDVLKESCRREEFLSCCRFWSSLRMK